MQAYTLGVEVTDWNITADDQLTYNRWLADEVVPPLPGNNLFDTSFPLMLYRLPRGGEREMRRRGECGFSVAVAFVAMCSPSWVFRFRTSWLC